MFKVKPMSILFKWQMRHFLCLHSTVLSRSYLVGNDGGAEEARLLQESCMISQMLTVRCANLWRGTSLVEDSTNHMCCSYIYISYILLLTHTYIFYIVYTYMTVSKVILHGSPCHTNNFMLYPGRGLCKNPDLGKDLDLDRSPNEQISTFFASDLRI